VVAGSLRAREGEAISENTRNALFWFFLGAAMGAGLIGFLKHLLERATP